MFSQLRLCEVPSSDGIYRGPARISFGAPAGTVSGQGTLRLSRDGHVRLRVEIADYEIPPEYNDFLMPFVQGTVPKKMGTATTFGIGPGSQIVDELEVTSGTLRFRASRGLVSNNHFELFSNQNAWVEIVPNDLEMIVNQDESDCEVVWCMPLFGDVGEFHRCGNACWIDDRIPYIHFESERHDCGLLIFDPQETPDEDRCDAIAFGWIGERPHGSIDEVRELIPSGLISALNFACGSDITSPWLDLRGMSGQLRRRIHQRSGTKQQDDGFPAFSRFDSGGIHSGIAEFLRCFFGLPKDKRRSLVPVMNLARSGSPGSATVDESIADLVKALDAMCKRNGIGRENLRGKLDPMNSSAVEQVTSDARKRLQQIRRQCKADLKLDQLGVIDKIISRQANVAGDELDFGIAVSALLNKSGFHDAAAMNRYYSQLANDVTWEGLLSSGRGQVIHSAAIHMSSRTELLAWFEFARHLHDICKRVILREVGYKGTYAASNNPYTGEYELERITPSSTTTQMGYKIPPAGI